VHPAPAAGRFALLGAKADGSAVLLGIVNIDPAQTAGRNGQTVIAHRQHYGRHLEATLSEAGVTLRRPARVGEALRPGSRDGLCHGRQRRAHMSSG
jgi:hypothetical protein